MNDLPYRSENVNEALAHTTDLTNEELGAYLRLQWAFWRAGGYLPNNMNALARIAHAGRRWGKIKPAILAKLTITEDAISCPLTLARLLITRELRRKRSATGTRGGDAVWGHRSERLTRSERLAKARTKGQHTAEQWKFLVKFCGGKCVKCASDDPITKDHIVPLYQGGSDGIDNIQPMCTECNVRKRREAVDYRPVGWQAALGWQPEMPGKTPAETPGERPAYNKRSKIEERGGRLRKVTAEQVETFECGIVVLMERVKLRRVSAISQMSKWLMELGDPDTVADLIAAGVHENLTGAPFVAVIDQRVKTLKTEREKGLPLPFGFQPNVIRK
jgi:uncharacterized protein YdaU (DUF1376 family)